MALSAVVVLTLLGLAWTSHLREHSLYGVTAITLAWGLLQLGVLVVGLARPPGRRPSRAWRSSAVVAALFLALLQPIILILGGTCSPLPPRIPGILGALSCAILSLACGALITGAMVRIWHRTDPFSPCLSGALLGVSGGLAGAVGVGFICTDHSVMHLWLGHFLPVVLLTYLGKLAGKRWLCP